MPSSSAILQVLTQAANEFTWLALLFHLYIAVLVLLVLSGVGIGKRLSALLLCVPLISVSVLAWVSNSPFNGFVFAAAALVLMILSRRMARTAVLLAPLPILIAGLAVVGFGWIYPHFLSGSGFVRYLYAAPIGVVPCPTLSVVVGVAIVVRSFESRAWSTVLALLGVFYGLFGVFKLGVKLDWGLFVGACVLLGTCWVPKRQKVAATGKAA